MRDLQRFLWFANFYRRFISGFSSVAAPLTAWTGQKGRSPSWNPDAFERLKEAFCTAPILCLPDPDLLFTVEVDASSSGVGVILSQRQGTPLCLRPRAYFSRKLSAAELNCDIRNRELLAIKLALQEWRHWLEGTQHPFVVITDHKNLEYLKKCQVVECCQARWALFFSRFNFTVTYCPGTQNGRADALSRQTHLHPDNSDPKPILPPAMILSPLTWEINQEIALIHHPTHPTSL